MANYYIRVAQEMDFDEVSKHFEISDRLKAKIFFK